MKQGQIWRPPDRACDRRRDDRKGYGFGVCVLIATNLAVTGAAAFLDSEPERRGRIDPAASARRAALPLLMRAFRSTGV